MGIESEPNEKVLEERDKIGKMKRLRQREK